jgi:hypothetical protein
MHNCMVSLKQSGYYAFMIKDTSILPVIGCVCSLHTYVYAAQARLCSQKLQRQLSVYTVVIIAIKLQ